jgi:hypothetical protein
MSKWLKILGASNQKCGDPPLEDIPIIKILNVGYNICCDTISTPCLKILDAQSELRTWNIEISTSTFNETFGIQLFGLNPNIVIDWGENLGLEPERYTTTGNKTNTYLIPGNYTIKLSGHFNNNGNIRLNPITASKVKSTSVIPKISGLTSFENSFLDCSSIVSVPENLFSNNTNVTNFNGCFANCFSLISLPEKLFAKNTGVTSFNSCFFNTRLFSIPSGLFANNTLVTDFNSCFYSFSPNFNLTTIPQNLFKNNIRAANFGNCFNNCRSITSIPFELFTYNTGATNFAGCFSSCSSLSTLPENLFSSNINATNFSTTFNSCTSLTSVPANLFANNTGVTNFNGCFFNVSLSTESYSNLLINMASNATSRKNNVLFGGGNSLYNIAGETAKQALEAKGWAFTDLGLSPTWNLGIRTVNIQGGSIIDNGNTLALTIIGVDPNITIDWGDGTIEQVTQGSLTPREHTYSPGEYIARIDGKFDSFGRIYIGQGISPITSPSSFRYKNLVIHSTSVVPFISGLESNFDAQFRNCRFLTGLPDGLFRHYPNTTSLEYCFYESSGIKSLPENIFSGANNISSLRFCFYRSRSLTGIPSGLFKNITGLTSVETCFQECNSISSIPKNLFVNNIEMTNFFSCFANCSITSIPSGLFDTNIKGINFVACFDGNPITSIPSGLFNNNIKAQKLGGFGFTQISSIPSGLFDFNIEATEFINTFAGCPITNIPPNLFKYNTGALVFFNTFAGTNITSVPPDLFSNNIFAWIWFRCFADCTSLTNLPSGLFANNNRATIPQDFVWAFKDCPNLTTIPPNIFANVTGANNFDQCFIGTPLSTSAYSNLLINMASNANSRPNNVSFGAQSSRYNLSAVTARQILTDKNWIISDLGLDS